MPPALPSHHDDHHGGAARRRAAGAEFRQRLGVAPAFGNYHYRRPPHQPTVDPLHHPGYLYLVRSAGRAILPAVRGRRRPRGRPTGSGRVIDEYFRAPLALSSGSGWELRRPLGITIIGGLLISQLLTLYTTPVIYIWFDRLAARTRYR